MADSRSTEPVVYGPFPVRLGLLLGGAGTLALGVLVGLMSRSDMKLAFFGLLLAMFGAAAVVTSLRALGRVMFELQHETLHVTRRRLGFPDERWTVDVAGVEDVEVAWSRQKSFFDRAHYPGAAAGLLIVRLPDGTTRKLSRQPLRGFHLHLRAERALRTLLHLSDRSAGRQAALDQAAESFEPPQLMGGGAGAKLSLMWIGICCGSLLGIGLVGIVLVSMGWASGSDSLQAWHLALGIGGGAPAGMATASALVKRAKAH